VCSVDIDSRNDDWCGEPVESNGNRAAASNGSSVFPVAPERDLVARACTACHAPELVTAKRHTPEEWDDIIAKMIDRGAQASDTEQQQILEYLVRSSARRKQRLPERIRPTDFDPRLYSPLPLRL